MLNFSDGRPGRTQSIIETASMLKMVDSTCRETEINLANILINKLDIMKLKKKFSA